MPCSINPITKVPLLKTAKGYVYPSNPVTLPENIMDVVVEESCACWYCPSLLYAAQAVSSHHPFRRVTHKTFNEISFLLCPHYWLLPYHPAKWTTTHPPRHHHGCWASSSFQIAHFNVTNIIIPTYMQEQECSSDWSHSGLCTLPQTLFFANYCAKCTKLIFSLINFFFGHCIVFYWLPGMHNLSCHNTISIILLHMLKLNIILK